MECDRRPEHELLITCARVRLDARARERLAKLVTKGLDWNLVERAALKHGVTSLVHHHLVGAGVLDLDDGRIAGLRARSFANSGNSLMLARELNDVLALFDKAGVAAIPYKGPALAASLYGNLALREYSDLDVLVKPDDALEARALLVKYGYAPAMPLTPAQERGLVRDKAEYFLRFDRPVRAGSIAFELHWRMPVTFSLDHDGLWHRLRRVSILSRSWPHFAPEDLLIVLCAHGFKHAWNTLKWISDVAQLVDTETELDWDVAINRARREGGTRVVGLGCALARAVFGTELPPRLVALVDTDAVVTRHRDLFCRHLFNQPLQRTGAINNFMIRERAQDRLRYGLGLFAHLTSPTTAERASWALPRGAGFVHYLAHPVRLAGRFARKYWM